MLWTRWPRLVCFALLGICFSCPGDTSAQKDRVEQPAKIPFRLYNDNLIVVKGTIGSNQDVNILLDTGTSPIAISTEIAGRLNVRGNTEPLLGVR
jgi:hypothetical protein